MQSDKISEQQQEIMDLPFQDDKAAAGIEEAEPLENLDKEKLVAIIRQSQVAFSGPIPPPNLLKKYDDALPGAADRILSMAEKEQSHRHLSEDKQVDAASRDSFLGLLFALIVTITVVVLGTSIILVKPSTGTLISGSLLNIFGVATLAQAFLRRDEKKEDKKEKQG